MAFSYTDHPLSAIFADGEPAYAADVNQAFSDIETELNDVSTLATNSVTTASIQNDAVTQAKIDISGLDPTADDDPTKVSWVNTQLTANKSAMFAMGTLWITDSVGNGLECDQIVRSADAYVEKVYQAQSDGVLHYIVHPFDEVDTTGDYKRRVIIWHGQSSVSGRRLDTWTPGVTNMSWLDYNLALSDNGQDCVYDQVSYRGGQTGVVPIKNGYFFKVMAYRHQKV